MARALRMRPWEELVRAPERVFPGASELGCFSKSEIILRSAWECAADDAQAAVRRRHFKRITRVKTIASGARTEDARVIRMGIHGLGDMAEKNPVKCGSAVGDLPAETPAPIFLS